MSWVCSSRTSIAWVSRRASPPDAYCSASTRAAAPRVSGLSSKRSRTLIAWGSCSDSSSALTADANASAGRSSLSRYSSASCTSRAARDSSVELLAMLLEDLGRARGVTGDQQQPRQCRHGGVVVRRDLEHAAIQRRGLLRRLEHVLLEVGPAAENLHPHVVADGVLHAQTRAANAARRGDLPGAGSSPAPARPRRRPDSARADACTMATAWSLPTQLLGVHARQLELDGARVAGRRRAPRSSPFSSCGRASCCRPRPPSGVAAAGDARRASRASTNGSQLPAARVALSKVASACSLSGARS